MPNKETPFEQDNFVAGEAEKHGMRVFRRAVIDIDKDILPPTYKLSSPDYIKIRRHLEQGIQVPGAKLTTRVEYILSPLEVELISMEEGLQ